MDDPLTLRDLMRMRNTPIIQRAPSTDRISRVLLKRISDRLLVQAIDATTGEPIWITLRASSVQLVGDRDVSELKVQGVIVELDEDAPDGWHKGPPPSDWANRPEPAQRVRRIARDGEV